MRGTLVLGAVLLAAGCGSAIDASYLLRGYDVRGTGGVKRVRVAGWAPAGQPELAALASQVATDLLKLRKNYLVYPPVTLKRDFGEACDGVEGVLVVRVLDLGLEGDDVSTRVETGLSRCSDGALVWRTEGEKKASSKDEHLQNLAAAYVARAGSSARRFAAPLFSLLQELLSPIPDPVLDDQEIMEKIELGGILRAAPFVKRVK
jgi:probable lipoprotein (TIGR04455 family)